MVLKSVALSLEPYVSGGKKINLKYNMKISLKLYCTSEYNNNTCE